MAKNITLLGASYSNVPAVELPQTGGGTAKFTDTSPTTATDSDVASGKIYFKADGTQSTGTSSGGGGGGGIEITQDAQGYIVLPKDGGGGGGDITVEALSVTQNGTYTAPTGKAYSPVTVNVSGGGGGESEYGYIYVQNTTATSVEIFTCMNDVNGNSVQNGTRVTIASGDTGTIPLTYQFGNTTRVNAVMRIRCSSWTTASALTVTGTSTVYTYKIGVGVGTAERNAFAYVNEVVGYTVVLGG